MAKVKTHYLQRVAGCIAVLALNCIFIASAHAAPKRNILFIVVDDLRTWVNYMGDYAGTVYTPNIDALANVSTRYLNAYTLVPQCAASRTSVLIGQSPATHGFDTASYGPGDPAYNAIYNNPQIVTLPEVMSQAGYHSATTGKVFNTPIPERWDESGPATVYSRFANAFDPGPDNTFFNPGVLPANEQHPDQTVANWAKKFIGHYNDSKPFFLATGFYQPHIPWRVPRWAFNLYPIASVVAHSPTPGDLYDEPADAVAMANAPVLFDLTQYELVQYAGKRAAYTQAYLASISHTDAMIGQVLTALAASRHANNTDIILWSDHGYHLGEKFHWRKMTFWEPAVKVPLLVSSPGNPDYPVGNVRDEVSLLDLAPTVLDLAGLAPFAQFEGAPLHDKLNRSPAEIFYRGGKAVVDNRWKVVDYDVDGPATIDDLAAYWVGIDPNEERNIIVPFIRAILKYLAEQQPEA